MTNSRHMSSPMRTRRRTGVDKVVSAGLATAACVGLVGVIGVRSIEESVAAQMTASADATSPQVPATSSQGLTEAQLDAYAAQLAAESAKLDAYRTQLARAAKKLQRASSAAAAQSPATPASVVPSAQRPSSKPIAKPVAKPAPAAKPAKSQSKSS